MRNKYDLSPLPETWGTIVKTYVKMDDPSGALDCCKEMVNETVKPSNQAYLQLIEAASNDGKWKPILEAFQHMALGKIDKATNVVEQADHFRHLYEEAGGSTGEYFDRAVVDKIPGLPDNAADLTNPADVARKIMGTKPLDEEELMKKAPIISGGVGVSSDPILQSLQSRKTQVAGIPSNLDMLPLHPDVQLPPKGHPAYARQVIRAKMAWRDETRRTVYVGNLQPELTEDQLFDFFQSVGKVTCIAPRRNVEPVVGAGNTYVQPSWFTFVEFGTQKGADLACQLGGYVIGDRPIKVGRANQPIVKSMVPNMVRHRVGDSYEMSAMKAKREHEQMMLMMQQQQGEDNFVELDDDELDRRIKEIIKEAEEDAIKEMKKRSKEDLYSQLENQLDEQIEDPLTASMKRRERKERRRRSASLRRKSDKIRSEPFPLSSKPTHAGGKGPARKRVDPHEGKFFNGWTWIPKTEAKDWIEANQVATLHHLEHTMTPGVATLTKPESILPPGIVATIEAENEKANAPPEFSGQTPFSDLPPQAREHQKRQPRQPEPEQQPKPKVIKV